MLQGIKNKLIDITPNWLIWFFANNYVGSYKKDDLEGAIDNAMFGMHMLSVMGFPATWDILGESTATEDEADAAADDYKTLITRIADSDLKPEYKPTVSVKLSALVPAVLRKPGEKDYGRLDYAVQNGDAMLEDNLENILKHAKSKGVQVTIDMEHFPWAQKTIEIHNKMKLKDYDICVAFPSRIKEKHTDQLIASLPKGSTIRVVKSVQIEPEELAYTHDEDIKEKMFQDTVKLLGLGHNVQLATHDDTLRRRVVKYIVDNNIDQERIKFQVLWGVGHYEDTHNGEYLLDNYGNKTHRFDTYNKLKDGAYYGGFGPSNVRFYFPITINMESASRYLKRRGKNNPHMITQAIMNLMHGLEDTNIIKRYLRKIAS